jgi:hypothetical protein
MSIAKDAPSAEPPIPANCDLRDFHFMPLDVVRLRDSALAIKATGEEFRAAVLLWCASWHQVPAGSLPDDDAELARLAGPGMTKRKWKRIRDGALHGWGACSDGRLYHPVIAEYANKAWAKKQAVMARIIRRLEIESGAWSEIRSEVFARDNYTCQYCGARGGRLECDHIVPVALGGRTELSNLSTACLPCNRSKGAMPLESWRKMRTGGANA